MWIAVSTSHVWANAFILLWELSKAAVINLQIKTPTLSCNVNILFICLFFLFIYRSIRIYWYLKTYPSIFCVYIPTSRIVSLLSMRCGCVHCLGRTHDRPLVVGLAGQCLPPLRHTLYHWAKHWIPNRSEWSGMPLMCEIVGKWKRTSKALWMKGINKCRPATSIKGSVSALIPRGGEWQRQANVCVITGRGWQDEQDTCVCEST